MPCFKQEKSLEFRSRRDTTNDRDPMAPKPVRPRAIRYHGLFGMSIAAQHLIVDDNWTPSSITDLYGNMAELLKRRVTYKQHETRTHRALLLVENKRVKTECADGRLKLQKITVGNNAHEIRNLLIMHRDMQRLYQKMPVYLVADNINQRTFVMRKERDRLDARLQQLKEKYRVLLMDRSKAVNMIKYENEYILQEEIQSRMLRKKIENSKVRLNAIRTINTTYKKMRQVLLQDEIFYEPILRSLDGDIEDQVNFIKHILYLGMPAIAKFKVLNRELLQLSEKARKNQQAKIQILNSLKKPVVIGPPQVVVREIQTNNPKRYLRLTESMAILKAELQTIEKTIKELRLTVLCSQAREIYPRIKKQVENNEKLKREVENKSQAKQMLEQKLKCSSLLSSVLLNNLSEEEINRLERIRELKLMMKTDEEFEELSVNHIKSRADAYVLMRWTVWNLWEILRHVDRNPKLYKRQYPNEFLKLPLLKFELFDVRAFPPELFEEDVDSIMHYLKRKVYKLMQAFTPSMAASFGQSRERYHQFYLEKVEPTRVYDDDQQDGPKIDDLLEDRTLASIPNRKQIKAQSARLLEEAAKREES
uniref:Dbuz\CG14609f-PA n=1 Tax=Drosophila buzzatii TaxID=7264 RepID=Q4VIV2_DROBU|nr:Dbuz\CG14609f-PA [Drosophila buzzatii]